MRYLLWFLVRLVRRRRGSRLHKIGLEAGFLPPFALSDQTLDLVETAIRARDSALYHIAADLACATTLAGL